MAFTPPGPIENEQPNTFSGAGGTMAGAAVGGLFDMANLFISGYQQKKAREAQIKENKKNRDWQEQMYNKYESPVAQAQQMREAGLNPMGNVSSQSVGSASTSSLPTPSSPTLGANVMQGAQIGLQMHNSRATNKLAREQFNQQVTEQNRRFLIDLTAQELSNEEKRALINSKLEELEGLRIDNETRRLNKKMLEDFVNDGGNTYKDESEQIKASVALCKKEYEYYDQNQQLIAQEIKSRINSMNASARASIESARLSKNSADSLMLENTTKKMLTQLSYMVGFDVSILPPGAQAEVCQIAQAVLDDRLSEQEAGSRLRDLLGKLRRAETYIQGSYTYNVGALTAGASSTYNANEFVP